MTDLTLLDVVETALTKHGAHSILDNLNGFVSDECWLCHTPIGTIRWLRALVAENERLKGDLERYDQKDRGKTRDINLLVPEIKKAHADLAAAQSAARSMAERSKCLSGARGTKRYGMPRLSR